MTRLIYACQFGLPRQTTVHDITSEYSTWIRDHYERQRAPLDALPNVLGEGGYEISPAPKHHLKIEHFKGSEFQIVRYEWGYPAHNDDSLIWTNRATIARLSDEFHLAHTIHIQASDFLLAPVQYDVGSPRVIRRLCETRDVQIGAMRVRARPYDVNTNEVPTFLELLLSRDRRLPVVFLTPYVSDEPCLIDGAWLAQRLAGVAVVACAIGTTTTRELERHLGRQLNCFDGGVRIYWPGFDLSSSPTRHPLFLASRIEWFGAQNIQNQIQRTIFAVTSFRYVPHAATELCLEASVAAAREARRTAAKGDEEKAWEFAFELDRQLVEARARVAELAAENETLKGSQPLVFDPSPAAFEEAEGDSDDAPTSVSDAVQSAKEKFGSLVFLESAERSAASSPYLGTTKIYKALEALNEVAQLAYPEAGGVRSLNWAQELRQRCSMKRYSDHVSDTTLGKYRSDYEFTYEGQKVLFEPHITLGSGAINTCASIHFLRDNKNRKVVIGHVGKHLTNTRS